MSERELSLFCFAMSIFFLLQSILQLDAKSMHSMDDRLLLNNHSSPGAARPSSKEATQAFMVVYYCILNSLQGLIDSNV